MVAYFQTPTNACVENTPWTTTVYTVTAMSSAKPSLGLAQSGLISWVTPNQLKCEVVIPRPHTSHHLHSLGGGGGGGGGTYPKAPMALSLCIK